MTYLRRYWLLAVLLAAVFVIPQSTRAQAACTNTISSVPIILNQAGAVYCLTSDINSGSGSINIGASNITIDGQGHAVNVSSDLVFNLAVSGTSISNTTVRNIRLLSGGVLTNGGAGVISSGSYWRVSAWVQDALIENSTFRNTRTDGYPMNQLYMWRRLTFRNNTVEYLNSSHNMLQLQYTIDSLFENNTFKFTVGPPNNQESFGWNIRDTSSRNTFRNNLLVENGKADICFGSQADARGLQDTDGTVVVNHPFNGDNIFQNNVIVSLPNTIGSFRIGGVMYATLTSGNNTFSNNIMYAVGNYALGLNDSIDNLGTLNHNTLVNTDGITSYVIMDVNGGSSTSVFTNNILYGKVGNSIGPGSSNNLIATNPQFVGPLPTWPDLVTSDNVVTMANTITAAVHLQGSSPAKNAGNDGKDEGVDFGALGSGPPPPPPDTTAPTVSITAPTTATTVSGTVTITATASDNVGGAGVTFYANGMIIGAEDTIGPYSVSWNTTTYPNGTAIALTAVARDAAGNMKTSSTVNVTVQQAAGITCTSFTYSAWGACQVNNTQTRTVVTSSPVGCTGGSPVLSQPCTYVPPVSCTENWYCGTWTNCSNGNQTRLCTDLSNCGTVASRPAITRTCSGSTSSSSSATGNGAALATASGESEPLKFFPEIPIPGLFTGALTISPTSIGEYIRAIFVYFIWVVGVVAVVMVMYGGVKWVAAAGNPGRINDARDTINSAIIGVIIALTSVVLLNIINPQFTNLKGLAVETLQKELGDFYGALSGTVPPCAATTVKGPPDLICTTTNICSAAGTLNDWINESVRPTYVSNNTGGLPDPVMVKAIIAKESLLQGRPVSRGTQVLASDGSPASSAYGIGQFVAGTLIEQLNKLAKQYATTIPTECPTNGKNPPGPKNNGVVEQTCKDWLDQPTSPGGSQLMPVGMKAQVFLVTNYLAEVRTASCVNGDIAGTAAAYYLGQGNVKYYCDPTAITQAKPNDQALLKQRIQEAQQYVNVFAQFYQSYCSASQ